MKTSLVKQFRAFRDRRHNLPLDPLWLWTTNNDFGEKSARRLYELFTAPVGFVAVVLEREGLYKEHFDVLVSVEINEAPEDRSFVRATFKEGFIVTIFDKKQGELRGLSDSQLNVMLEEIKAQMSARIRWAQSQTPFDVWKPVS